MTEIQQAKSGNTSLGHDVVHAVRYYLKGRRGVFVLAGTALVAGLAFNWSWLVAPVSRHCSSPFCRACRCVRWVCA